MSEAVVKPKPFWVSDDEKHGLQHVPQCNVDVASAVPELTWVTKGVIEGAYVLKDGLLIYHIYKSDRKQVYDAANEGMDRIRDTEPDKAKRDALQNELSRVANSHMAEVPWWSGILDTLEEVCSEHFLHQSHKVTYYPEVDSCSVMLPEPTMPGAKTKAHLEAFFTKLALRVQG
jgi:hypothetical protein